MSLEARAKSVFCAAIEHEPSDRLAAARDACAGEHLLWRRVERLLAAHGPVPALESLPHPAAHDDLIGRRIGHFQVESLIATGGMGRVYLAVQDSPRRPVALKVMPADPASAPAMRRFEHEAAILSRLTHPGISHVYHAGVFPWRGEARPYLAMELIQGAEPITTHANRLPLSARIRLIAGVCDAVTHAHERGIIHRDLKPSNILVDAQGRPSIIDFGVAKLAGSASTLRTRPGQIIGTLAYMSPEQCRGDAPAADERSDVYSLGAVLYELACGRPPHDLSALPLPAALARIQTHEPAPPRSLAPHLPLDLEAVLLKCLRTRPADRYPSAAALAADLRAFLAGDPVRARRPSPAARVRRWARRHPVLSAAAASTTLAAAILGGTLALGRVLSAAPDHLELAGDHKSISLYSQARFRLARWDAGPDGQIYFSAMIERPKSLGAGRLVLLGFDHRSTFTPVQGGLAAFDASRPDTPLWTTADSPLVPPPGYADRRNASTALDLVQLADVIPDAPGPEILVVQSLYPYSPAAIRVFDLSGRVRYEVWHDGTIGGLHWLASARRLIACGLSSERRWDERGHAAPGEPHYPLIAMSLEIADGHLAPGAWLLRGGQFHDPTLLWYKWFGPPEQLPVMPGAYTALDPPGSGWDNGRYVLLSIRSPGIPGSIPGSGITMLLDEHGTVQDRWDDDGYKARRLAGAAPQLAAFSLFDYADLPPATTDLPDPR